MSYRACSSRAGFRQAGAHQTGARRLIFFKLLTVSSEERPLPMRLYRAAEEQGAKIWRLVIVAVVGGNRIQQAVLLFANSVEQLQLRLEKVDMPFLVLQQLFEQLH